MLTPDLIPPELAKDERRLAGLCRPALDLEQSEIGRLCLDRFLQLYTGHPHRPREVPLVVRDGIDYSQKWLGSYSKEGSLVCVRYAPQSGLNSAQHYFVAGASLSTGQVKEWQVHEARYRYRPEGGGPIQTDLVLAQDGEMTEASAYPVLTGHDEVIDEVKLRDYQQRLIKADAKAARVIMTPHGCWFKPFGGELESLAPVGELVADLQIRLPQLLGRTAIETTPVRDSDVA